MPHVKYDLSIKKLTSLANDIKADIINDQNLFQQIHNSDGSWNSISDIINDVFDKYDIDENEWYIGALDSSFGKHLSKYHGEDIANLDIDEIVQWLRNNISYNLID